MAETAAAAMAVTPSDATLLAPGVQALFVGTGGDVSVTPEYGEVAVVFKGVGDGQLLPVRARKVNSTNTTASNIVALY